MTHLIMCNIDNKLTNVNMTINEFKTTYFKAYTNWMHDCVDKSGKIDVKDFLKMDNNEILKKNGGRRYDVCLMNPPYSGSTHLKFLEKTIEIAEKVVSIQPITWLQDINAANNPKSQKNKYNDSINKHIKDLEIITSMEAKKQFNILFQSDCGIYVCDKDGGFNTDYLSSNPITERVHKYILDNPCNIERNKKDGYRVRISFNGAGKAGGSGDNRQPYLLNIPIKDIVFKDGKYNGKWWYQYYVKNQYSKTTEEITSSIKFNSEEEGHNFARSFQTRFVLYIESNILVGVGVNEKNMLWMGNAKHPRTGTIGYKDEWTDNDFYDFFDITDDEKQTIDKYFSDFENNLKEWKQTHGKK